MAAPTVDLTKIRNIGVIAHIDAGKTTTTEHLLYYAGAKHKLGGVDEGTTETDFDPEEQERGITIYSACVPLQWLGHHINLIDTPGHVDFTAEVERSLRVLDGCVCVFDAQKGVEAQSETVWRQANKYGVPRLVFINKMDVVGANYANALKEIHDKLDGVPLPLVIPIGAGSIKETQTPFKGVIDLLLMKALYFDAGDHGKTIRVAEIPDENRLEAEEYREKLFDLLTQHNDEIMGLYLEGQPVPVELVRKVVRELTISKKAQPVLCGSGREHMGIQPLLDAVCHYLPSPLDRPPVTGINPKKDKEEKRKPELKEPFAGLVFKVIAQDSGDLYFVRVYSGTLKANTRLYNPGKDVKEVVGKLYRIHADTSQRDDLSETYAGDIIAVIGLKDSVTGDTLCETQHPILLEPITFANAVVSQRIEPESGADKDNLLKTLNKLQREDPTFIVEQKGDTGELLMRGMGTLHLEVKRHRMERDFRLKIRVYKPQVSYRETLQNSVTVEGECDRVVGNKAVFAKVKVAFEVRKDDKPTSAVNKMKPNTIPAPLPEQLVRDLSSCLGSGGLGFPVMDVHATILDATFDPERSTDAAFSVAIQDAVHKAFSRDNMKLLEPLMKLTVQVPDESMGQVFAYVQARRGEVQSQHSNGKLTEIVAHVPLESMFNYADELRSVTQGRASSSMEPYSYAAAPADVLKSYM